MKLSYYHQALIIGAVAIFYANVPSYVYVRWDWTLLEAPKHWVLLFCLFSIPVLLGQTAAWNALKSPIGMWCFGYAVLTVLSFIPSSHSELAWQEIRWRFVTIILLITFLIVFWKPAGIRLARRTLVGGVLFAVALNIYELFVPMTFSQDLGRSAGLYINPNIAGEALVAGMILSVTVLPIWYRGPFLLLTGIGVFATLSRASILGWLIAVAGIILLGGVRLKDLLVSASVVVLLVVLILLPQWNQLLTTWERTGVLNVNVLERLDWLTDPSGVSDYSSWERKYVAQRAWDKIEEHPFFGSGTGAFHQAGVLPHNQYLALMLDHGLVGAVILPLLILAATWGARGGSKHIAIVFACVVAVMGLFTHSILYREHSLLLFSLMAAIVLMSRDRQGLPVAMAPRKAGTTHAVVEA
jgi:O-antigen ligase